MREETARRSLRERFYELDALRKKEASLARAFLLPLQYSCALHL